MTSETTMFDNFPKLNVVLTNTFVPRSTKVLVRGVKKFKDDFPSIVDPILDSIGEISRTFCKDVLASKVITDESSRKISRLIQTNHHLLCALGVSHPSLNMISNLTTELYNDLKTSSKLTGAGGGGCAFTFLEEDFDKEGNDREMLMKSRLKVVIDKIESLDFYKNAKEIEQSKSSFRCFTSVVGGDGVLWL